ncbi:MAG: hypothetical protein ACTHK4_01210 [Mycobacteriales bacterium]
MRDFTRLRTAVVVLAAGAATVAMTGVGYAYFTAAGNGTGQLASGQAKFSVSSNAGPTQLYPGGNSGTITVTLTNNAAGNAIKVTQLSPAASTAMNGCTASSAIDFTQLDSLPSALTTTATVRFTVAMVTKAEAACAGATFTITFTAYGTLG